MYSKDEILELYLNKVYFGDGLYGAEAAARGYFGKSAADLDLAEAALLAGLVNAPSVERADRQPVACRRTPRARAERDARAGHHHRTRRSSARRTRKSALRRHPAPRRAARPVLQGRSPAAAREAVRLGAAVRRRAEGLHDDRSRRCSARPRRTWRIAAQIEADARCGGREAEGARRPANQLEAALVAMDPTTGEVRAMVGGRDFKASRFNRATQALRQPGSAFKPFVYAAALEAGYSPASLVTRLDEPIQTLQGAWMPEDEHSTLRSEMTVRAALRTSSNRAAVRMLEEVGIAKTVAQARKMGIGNVPSVPSLALGSGEVTLMAMTSAYAAFADGGGCTRPRSFDVSKTPTARCLFEAKPARRTGRVSADRVPDDEHAVRCRQLRHRIQGAAGGLHAARPRERPARRTTTSTHGSSGFTPHLVTGVWVGFDKPRTIISNGFAGELAVPMWARFMKVATANDKPDTFKMAEGLTVVSVCRLSGKLPSPGCDRVRPRVLRSRNDAY